MVQSLRGGGQLSKVSGKYHVLPSKCCVLNPHGQIHKAADVIKGLTANHEYLIDEHIVYCLKSGSDVLLSFCSFGQGIMIAISSFIHVVSTPEAQSRLIGRTSH